MKNVRTVKVKASKEKSEGRGHGMFRDVDKAFKEVFKRRGKPTPKVSNHRVMESEYLEIWQ
jgi:hypothetical protein